jgi:methyltransferase
MVEAVFVGLLLLTILQRLFELRLANRNTKNLLEAGAVEFGASHYPIIIAIHTAFFLSLVTEFSLQTTHLVKAVFLVFFLLAQLARFWVLKAMDDRWTTRVLVIKGEKLVAHGPYRFVQHPNYLIVCIEIATLPLTFGLIWTALAFSTINLLALLFVRLPVERKALNWSQEAA